MSDGEITIKERDRYFSGPAHGWFSLSYASYLVLPRSALQSMPLDWQQRFVALMEEWQEIGPRTPDEYVVQLRGERGRFVEDPWANYRRPNIKHLLPEALR